MFKESLMLDEIEVDVSGFFTTHHHFQTQAGLLGKLTFPAFAQYGTYHAPDGREVVMQRTHWLDSSHELVDGGTVRGRADRAGLLRRDILLQFDGRRYSLEPEGLLSQGWLLFDAEGNRLLEIQPRGILKQGSYLTLTGALDGDLIAFVYYLVYTRQQEEWAAVAATTAAS